jgi:hypothetical protein
MRVDDEMLKSVAFIGHTEHAGPRGQADIERYDGTGFYVSVPSKHPGVFPFVYLVTSKHVIEKTAPNFWVRENLKAGGVTLEPGDTEWVAHPSDETVDVAVFPWKLPEDRDHLPVPKEDFASREKFGPEQVGIGDELFLVGVFPSASGTEGNTPIVRKGNLAMLPEGKVRVKRDQREQYIDAFLIEAHSFGGISGSPIFVRETTRVRTQAYGKSYDARMVGPQYLLGLVWGHYEIDSQDINAMHPRPPVGQELGLNLGIGIAVPAWKILETLNHSQLLAQRRSVEDESARSGKPAKRASTRKRKR